MVDKKGKFRYFHDPYAFSNYLDEPTPCPICKCVGSGFEGPFKGDEHLDFVCTECLVSGKLAAIEVVVGADVRWHIGPCRGDEQGTGECGTEQASCFHGQSPRACDPHGKMNDAGEPRNPGA